MAHTPRLIVVGYLTETQPADTPVVELLRCGDCGALVAVGESQRMHLSWHRSLAGGPGDASALRTVSRSGW